MVFPIHSQLILGLVFSRPQKKNYPHPPRTYPPPPPNVPTPHPTYLPHLPTPSPPPAPTHTPEIKKIQRFLYIGLLFLFFLVFF